MTWMCHAVRLCPPRIWRATSTCAVVRCTSSLTIQRGKWHNVGMPIKLSASPASIKRSPLLGEHTDEILKEVLGWSDEEIAAKKHAGAFSTTPSQTSDVGAR